MSRRKSEFGRYYVAMRDAERQLLGRTLMLCNWDYRAAAEQLDLGERYLKARVVQLGGILPNTDRNEPPPPIWPKKEKPREEAP